MPRPGPQREATAVRLSVDGYAELDRRAVEEGLIWNGRPNRSETIRLMLKYASAHMPKGWRPG